LNSFEVWKLAAEHPEYHQDECTRNLDDNLPWTWSSSIVGKLRVFKDVVNREKKWMRWDGEMGKQISSWVVETQHI
jgi:hypothetical protein